MITSAKSRDDVGLAASGHDIHAIVDAVNHNGHVNGLRGLTGGTLRKVGIGRIVTEHAILWVVPPISVQRKTHVALIAIGFSHHRAARRHRRAVDGEIEDLIWSSAFHLLSRRRAR